MLYVHLYLYSVGQTCMRECEFSALLNRHSFTTPTAPNVKMHNHTHAHIVRSKYINTCWSPAINPGRQRRGFSI